MWLFYLALISSSDKVSNDKFSNNIATLYSDAITIQIPSDSTSLGIGNVLKLFWNKKFLVSKILDGQNLLSLAKFNYI